MRQWTDYFLLHFIELLWCDRGLFARASEVNLCLRLLADWFIVFWFHGQSVLRIAWRDRNHEIGIIYLTAMLVELVMASQCFLLKFQLSVGFVFIIIDIIVNLFVVFLFLTFVISIRIRNEIFFTGHFYACNCIVRYCQRFQNRIVHFLLSFFDLGLILDSQVHHFSEPVAFKHRCYLVRGFHLDVFLLFWLFDTLVELRVSGCLCIWGVALPWLRLYVILRRHGTRCAIWHQILRCIFEFRCHFLRL